jgi:hypothetical protein
MQILDGKETAQNIRIELQEAVKQRRSKGEKIPHLAAILVGNDGGSMTYVNAKVKACEQIGFDSTLIKYNDISEADLLAKVNELNNDDNIDGFIVGSDQVWRYIDNSEALYRYFFDFVDEYKIKISYAASFGVDYWPTNKPVVTKNIKDK